MTVKKQKTAATIETVVTEAPKGWQYNRPLAIALIVIAVLFSVLFGVHKGVRAQYREITEAYAEGLDSSGYGLQYYEQRMEEHASNLCKIAGKSKYDAAFQPQAEKVTQATYVLANAKTAGEKFEALQQLINAVDALNLEMADAGLEADDEELRLAEYQNFTDQFYKARNISVDYNELVRKYNDKVLGGFPASALKELLNLPEAEEFS